jgi:glycosyltransferase involved in cell wall biosynthesis
MPEPSDTSSLDLSLVVPCYNEEQVLANTMRELVEAFDRHQTRLELVIVDNGSRDGTQQVIDRLIDEGLPIVKCVVPVNEGYGNGILTGFAASRAPWVGVVHADGQVDAADVYKVYAAARNARRPCLVKVRRRFRMDGLRRKIVSIFYNLIINVLYPRLGSIDVNGNPKLLPREYLHAMRLQSKDWFLDPEMMIKARRLGLPVIEFNVLSQMRSGGKSNVNTDTCREFVVNLLRWRFGGVGPLGKPTAEAREAISAGELS